MKKKLTSLSGAVLLASGPTDVTPPPITPETAEGGIVSVSELTSSILGYVLYIIAAIAVIALIYGGYLYMTAGGDAEKTTKARNVILYSILGILVVGASYLIVEWATGGNLFDFFTGGGNTL